MVEAFTQSTAKVEAYKGGIYSILNGQISGEFIEVDRPTRIMLRWRQNTWPDGKAIEISTVFPPGTPFVFFNLPKITNINMLRPMKRNF